MSPKLPMLTGYRVLDITQFVAGPTCTRLLAESGADVIKVELAPHGDRSRIQGIKPRAKPGETAASSQSTYFFQHNHSKRSLALAWKHPRTTEILKTLAAKADVLVENFSPGVMARAGLAYEDLAVANPRLIMCSISVAGQTGPLSAQPGYDYIAAAYAGVTDQIGEPDGAPAQFSLAIGDVSTGVAAAMAIGFALLHRERTGEGQLIDAAILDTHWDTDADASQFAAALDGYVAKLKAAGRSAAVLTPAPDRVVVISANSDDTLGKIANVLGLAG